MSDNAPNSQSLNTLISTSSTIAGMGLALVGILAAKQPMQKTEMVSDDLFLFSSLGFLLVVGYLAQKNSGRPYAARLIILAGWLFSLSLITVAAAACILLYAEV